PDRILSVTFDCDEVLISAFKWAERGADGAPDKSGDLILRIYSVAAEAHKCGVGFGFPIAAVWLSNLAEDCVSTLDLDRQGRCSIDLSPFEIKTLRIRPRSQNDAQP
ncbi:MAG: hypothetical protein KAU28_06445, partial [Phycisphaerae bacterium]|nr:hypothetical protein [Phycisphaerae bacterium]